MGEEHFKILCVDDHQDTLELAAKVLAKAGHSITTATTFQGALDCAGRDKFDLLVVDVGLPDGNGLELLARVRMMYPVPGIVMSGYGMADDIRKSYAAGFDIFLLKPVSINVLIEAVDILLHDPSTRSHPQPSAEQVMRWTVRERASSCQRDAMETNYKSERMKKFEERIKVLSDGELVALAALLRRTTLDLGEETLVMQERIKERLEQRGRRRERSG